MEWSPQAAMEAYMNTLQLSQNKEKSNTTYKSKEIIEPKCMEFISALAAGKQAKLMVEISTEGITPFTIALAVAAKQTGGRFICILVHENDLKKNKAHLKENHQDLINVIEFVYGDPIQLVMENYNKDIDLLVIDGKLDDHLKLVKMVNVGPHGCIIVGHNLHCRKNNNGVSNFGHILKGKKLGVGIVTLPIGEGIELTRIESANKSKANRRCRRFHVTFEN